MPKPIPKAAASPDIPEAPTPKLGMSRMNVFSGLGAQGVEDRIRHELSEQHPNKGVQVLSVWVSLLVSCATPSTSGVMTTQVHRRDLRSSSLILAWGRAGASKAEHTSRDLAIIAQVLNKPAPKHIVVDLYNKGGPTLRINPKRSPWFG